jgi:hypothetical protein
VWERGAGEEMTQIMYAHVNKKKKRCTQEISKNKELKIKNMRRHRNK